jgi:hypothetical protein
MPRRSSNSAGATYLDKTREELRRASEDHDPRVRDALTHGVDL